MTARNVFAIDPSSTVTGYARMSYGCELMNAGRLTAPRRTMTPIERIRHMRAMVVECLEEDMPAVVVIEITSGKVGSRHRGVGAGLAVYGMAVGGIVAEVENVCDNVVTVLENDWTGGVRKLQRQREIAAQFPAYRAIQRNDRGGDVADAIGLCLWFIANEKKRAAASQ